MSTYIYMCVFFSTSLDLCNVLCAFAFACCFFGANDASPQARVRELEHHETNSTALIVGPCVTVHMFSPRERLKSTVLGHWDEQ